MTAAKIPHFLKKLIKQLRSDLNTTKVDIEKVSGLNRYRLAVVSPNFNKMPHLRRQDRIWSVVDQVLSKEDSLKISLILAFAPQEIAPAKPQQKGRKRKPLTHA